MSDSNVEIGFARLGLGSALKQYHLQIPLYQREYSWESSERFGNTCVEDVGGMTALMEDDQLRLAVESQHSCRAALAQTVPVRETFQDLPVWEGIVHVFDVRGHPQATRAYAWSSTIEGSERRRYYAILGIGAIKTPLDAVRAAIVAEHRGEAGG